ncbi:DoxX family protein [Arenicella xantha]|uniref:Putative oxidoreductase n=1 Tax=Arenicella xantha TaxID=644221 RepID=A0A395JFR7_9GAMM|nr:DoxX family protein [Arenicella xantha]RBP47186.1 putative oxidoreductase [Arenicella xantha]
MKFLKRWDQELLSILRIVAAFMFTLHGTQKIFGFPIDARYAWDLWTLSPGAAGMLEIVLGPLLLVGLFTRPAAFVLSGLMAFAYFIAHAPQSFYPIANGGENAVLYCFVFLYFAAAGGGKWSLDRLRKS